MGVVFDYECSVKFMMDLVIWCSVIFIVFIVFMMVWMFLLWFEFFFLYMMFKGYKVEVFLFVLVFLVVLNLSVIFGEVVYSFKISIDICCKLGMFFFIIFILM